jgi:tRNA A37 N6-isopentenylltransferase MiaA
MKTYNLLAIIGPTASGKTALAAHLATQTDGEVISADSRQVYRGMDIGTGKDKADYWVEGRQVPVHLVDIVDAGYQYNVFEYHRDFMKVLEDLRHRKKFPVLCGGSGLYIEAVLQNYRLIQVPVNEQLRSTLKGKSLEELTAILKSYKSNLHNITDIVNEKRAIRAIEIEDFYQNNYAMSHDFDPMATLEGRNQHINTSAGSEHCFTQGQTGTAPSTLRQEQCVASNNDKREPAIPQKSEATDYQPSDKTQGPPDTDSSLWLGDHRVHDSNPATHNMEINRLPDTGYRLPDMRLGHVSPGITPLIIGILYDLETRRERITARLHQRLKEGMVEEVRKLLSTGIHPDNLIYYGLEYKFITHYLTGKLTFPEMAEQLNIAIHQFAKRQMTWFRKMERQGTIIHWLDGKLPLEQKIVTVMELLGKKIED